MITASEITASMLAMENEAQRQVLLRFFKTGYGEYGYGDQFLGIKVPQTRAMVKGTRLQVSLDEIDKLIGSKWHEVRLCGFLLLVEEMLVALPKRHRNTAEAASRRAEVADFYIAHSRQANNWDLVDLSCPKILGKYLLAPLPDGSLPSRSVLYELADSTNLWQQRIAVVSTIELIRAGQFADTLSLVVRLMHHRHELMHKAMGWMLREIGKKDMTVLDSFLDEHYASMPRTMLRYAIEKKDAAQRQFWLDRKPRL